LLTDAQKRTHDLIEHFTNNWLARAVDLRDLSRTQRRRSHFPTLQALLNAVNKVVQLGQETDELIAHLNRELEEIQEHSKIEMLTRG
jgi:hypothetical protein